MYKHHIVKSITSIDLFIVCPSAGLLRPRPSPRGSPPRGRARSRGRCPIAWAETYYYDVHYVYCLLILLSSLLLLSLSLLSQS